MCMRARTVPDTLMRGSELEKNGKQCAPHQVSLTPVKLAVSSSPQLPVGSFKIRMEREEKNGNGSVLVFQQLYKNHKRQEGV